MIIVDCNQHLAGLQGGRVNGVGWLPGGLGGQLLDG